MKLRLLLPLLAGISFLSLPLSGQVFIGSDNFDDNTLTMDSDGASEQPGVWSYQSNSSGGSWVETGGHVEHRNATTPVGVQSRGFLAWVDTPESVTPAGGAGLSGGTPYSSDWTAQVTASNLLTSLTTGFTLTGFEAYTRSATGSNAYYGIYLHAGPSGATNLRFEWGSYNPVTEVWTRTNTQTATADTTDVLLRMTFDSATKGLALDYSFNSGATFLSGATFDLDGAHAGLVAPHQGGIALQLAAVNSNTGLAIGAGQMTFDNFSVTAIPEPSTYAAALASVALLVAAYRRRKQHAAAIRN